MLECHKMLENRCIDWNLVTFPHSLYLVVSVGPGKSKRLCVIWRAGMGDGTMAVRWWGTTDGGVSAFVTDCLQTYLRHLCDNYTELQQLKVLAA